MLDTVEVVRNHTVESAHRLAWCLVRDGEVAAESAPGVAGMRTFLRSAVKPLQVMASLRAGVPAALGLGERHVAIACASHGGTDEHLAVVREILAAAGVGEDALGCGPLAPLEPAAARALEGEPGRIHHNCSGKHAMGLALCTARGWPVEGYWRDGHPLQDAMRIELAAGLGMALEALDPAADGCGMRTYAAPLAALATAFAELPEGPAAAMRAHPHLVAYAGAIDCELMRAVPGAVAKIGAEGVLAVGLPERRAGLAIKVLDGAMRPLDPAGVGLTRELLAADASSAALDALARPLLHNSRGNETGCLRLV